MSGSIHDQSAAIAEPLTPRLAPDPLRSDSPPAKERADWADVARGIGIILVVFEHAARGIVGAGIAPYTDAFRLQDAAIYGFHMPLFFFLSGCFFSRGDGGLERFARSRIASLAYPYFLWSLIVGTVAILAGDLVNNPLPWRSLLAIPWRPILQFWFLYALLLCHAAGYFTRSAAILMVIAAALHIATGFTGVGNIALASAHYFIYFALGVAGAAIWRRASTMGRLQGAGVFATASLGVAGLLAKQQAPYALDSFHAAVRFALAAFGIAATIGCAIALQRKAPLLSSLGRASMAIYVMHTLFSAGIRIALQRVGVEDPLSHNVVGSTIGLAAPFAAYLLAKRAGISVQLGLGK